MGRAVGSDRNADARPQSSNGLVDKTMSPPWARAMSRAIARPRPEPPSSWLRASSSRRKGRKTFPVLGRNAGSVVVDVDRDETLLAPRGDDHVAAVSLGVGDEIADAAFHRQRPDLHVEVALRLYAKAAAMTRGPGAQFLKRRAQICQRRQLASIASRERQIAFQHRLHFVDVLLQRLGFRRVFDHRERQPETCEDSPEIVADAIQHGHALFGGAFDAPLHLDEGISGLSNFTCAARLKFEIAAFPEVLRGGRQT